jgi:hypothetical protein
MIVLPRGAGGLAERPEDTWARGIVLAAAAGVAGLLIIRFVAASAVPSVPAPWGSRASVESHEVAEDPGTGSTR